MATALLPALGYEGASKAARQAAETGRSLREVCVGENLLTEKEYEALITPEAVCRLGMPDIMR